MAPRKSERIVNLTICLLSSRRYLPKERIREVVEGYHDLTDSAFERTFERDKDDLRGMGVPIEMGSNDKFFDDEIGYRIRRADFELPPVDFTPDEVTALGAAARVWQQASAARQTAKALGKLRAVGVEPDVERLAALEPAVTAREPAFDALWQATISRSEVSFRYRGSDEMRHVEPWSVIWRKGSWYLLGRDTDRDQDRMFKMSRIRSLPTVEGEPGGYRVPDNLAERQASLEPVPPDDEALVAVRGDRAPTIRRAGAPADPPHDVQLPEGFAVWRVPYARSGDFVGQICAAGPDAVVLEPRELRERVLAQLIAVVAAHPDPRPA